MEEIKSAGNVILVIDEVHTLIGAGAAEGAIDAAIILKPALARAINSGKTACLNVKCRGVISPIVAATSDKRDKASIE